MLYGKALLQQSRMEAGVLGVPLEEGRATETDKAIVATIGLLGLKRWFRFEGVQKLRYRI